MHAPCQAEGAAGVAQLIEYKGEKDVIPAHGSGIRTGMRQRRSGIRTAL
ncbi:hypothetical protein D8I24_0874 [Cupriavidus necator H850]|nr:hypothetical protein D8I24_0874 [Cupriavidus necator H850]